MKSVIFITDLVPNLSVLADAYRLKGQVQIQPQNRLLVQGKWGWFAFEFDDSLASDFEELELNQVKAHISVPHFAQLLYSTTTAADLAVLGYPAEGVTLIDNDHGLIAQIDEIRRRILQKIIWQGTPGS